MAEQFIIAFAVRSEDLFGLVGSRDERLSGKIRQAAEDSDVGELLEEAGMAVEEVLAEVLAKKLKADHAYGYRRLLEAVGGVVGKALSPEEVVLPGRGWQELGPAWKHWGFKRLAGVWGGSRSGNRELPWPWKRSKQVEWPVALLIPNGKLKELRVELKKFSAEVVLEKGVPSTIDRFSEEDYWPRDDLAGELVHARDGMISWMSQAIKARRDLLLLHDGQQ